MVQTYGITLRLGADATLDAGTASAMPTNDDGTLLPLSLPSICPQKVAAACDGGLIDTLATIIPGYRDPNQADPHTWMILLLEPLIDALEGFPRWAKAA
jgi:hypothetical protein